MTHQPFIVSLARNLAEGLVRIPLAMLGRFVMGAQKFAITRDDIAQMVANFRKRAAKTVIDYEHASAHPAAAAGAPIPAAGWIDQVEDEPDEHGTWWGMAELTERARQMIAAGELRYLSPEIAYGARDKTSGVDQGTTLLALAITNRPFLDAMPAIALSDGWQPQPTIEAGNTPEKEQPVSGTTEVKTEPRVVRLADVPRDSKTGLFQFDRIEASDSVVIASEVMTARNSQERAIALVDGAVQAGKVLPAQRDAYVRLALSEHDSTKSVIDAAKPAVDLSEKGHAGGGAETSKTVQLSEVDREIGELARKKLDGNKNLTLGQATCLVLDERNDLREKRNKLTR